MESRDLVPADEEEKPHFWSPAELLTRRFYDWELRGRGWRLWPHPVELEPPFAPFHHRLKPLPLPPPPKVPSLLESFGSLFRSAPAQSAPVEPESEFDLPATRQDEAIALVEIHIAVPRSLFGSRDIMEQFLEVSTAAGALGFEIIGAKDQIIVELVTTPERSGAVRRQLAGHFPGIVTSELRSFLPHLWSTGGEQFVVVDFGLSEEFLRPLKTSGSFSPDPLVALIAALEGLRDGEIGVFQVLLRRAENPWAESIVRAAEGPERKGFLPEVPELVSLAKEKVRYPLYAAVIRVAARSTIEGGAWRIVQGMGAALSAVARYGSNELVPLENDGYPRDFHELNLLYRATHRNGMLLSSHELLSLVHLPTPAVASPSFIRTGKRTRSVPKRIQWGDIRFGLNEHEGETKNVELSTAHRRQHTYIVGATGTGKSTLLRNLILQDIEAGNGLALLDPHGDLVDEVIEHLPNGCIDRVILLDPADADCPIGFNVLQAHTELEKTLLSSDLVALFRRFSTTWGDQMSAVLGNAVLAILESPRGGTLVDLRRFLIDRDFRAEYLSTVSDPEVRYWWAKQFPEIKGNPQASIVTRLDSFLRPKLVRNIVGQRDAKLDLSYVMASGQVFLAKLSHGLIGDENAQLLGSLLVSKFHQLAMARQADLPEDRPDFQLYIDEFHHFVSPSMSSILAGGRKYRLGLTVAHQGLRQLASRDKELLESVLSNAATRVVFRVSEEDAKALAQGFAHFEPSDLVRLGVGEAILRVERSEDDCNLRTELNPHWLADADDLNDECVRQLSQDEYGRTKEEVQAELAAAYGLDPVADDTREVEQPASSEPPVAPPASEPVTPEPKPPEPAPAPSCDVPIAEIFKREPPPPGKGGPAHKALQTLIRDYAQDRGYRVSIEMPVLDGAGQIDVALEKDGELIACEISVSTSPEHELENVRKCLRAGAARVFVVSNDKSQLREIQGLMEERFAIGEHGRMGCVPPNQLFDVLDSLNLDESVTDSVIRGWNLKRFGSPVRAAAEARERKRAILAALHRRTKSKIEL